MDDAESEPPIGVRFQSVTKQLILLAGLHKTATTSTQQTCALNATALGEAGFCYPVSRFQDGWESNHTRLLNGLFRREPHKTGLQSQFTLYQPPCAAAREALREKWEAAVGDGERILLIAEGVSLFEPDELRAMKDWFEQRDWNVRLMCHVRHLSAWTNSIVAQRVTGGMRFPIQGVIDEFVRHGSVVRGRIENLRQVFPDAEFFSHERAVKHPLGPVGFFFKNIGFRPPEGLRVMRANEGRSDCATRVLSIINEKFGRFDASAQLNPQVLGERALVPLMETVGGQKFKLHQEEVQPLLPMLHAENQWLRDTLGDDFFDPQLGFKTGPWRWNPETLKQLVPVVAGMPPHVREWLVASLPRIDIRLRSRGQAQP